MKIAVASDDGSTIARHFGRSACFIIFEIEDGKAKGREVRTNTFTAHARGECTGDHLAHAHGHATILEALHDCQAVLCHGMGWRAAEDLKARGIQPLILPGELLPEQALEAYLRGDLQGGKGFCQCHD